jgi:hypothetical protein
MFVRSTGLGRTLLRGRIAIVETTELDPATLEMPTNGTVEPMRMLMAMEILHPVHWTVRAFLDPADLRHMVWLIIRNPAFILRAIKFLFTKGPTYAPIEAVGAPATGATATASKAGPGPVPGAKATSQAAPKGPPPVPSRN